MMSLGQIKRKNFLAGQAAPDLQALKEKEAVTPGFIKSLPLNVQMRAAFLHGIHQFGDRPLEFRGIKFAEEAGEVCKAIVRHVERRDGRGWKAEIAEELANTIVTMMMICQKEGIDFEDVVDSAVTPFLFREWNVAKRNY